MIVEIVVKGYFEENCYFYIDDASGHGYVIDPGAEGDRLLALIREKGWTIEKILLTHGHFDHMGAVDVLRDALGIPVYAHRKSDEYLLSGRMNLSSQCVGPILVRDVRYLEDGDVVTLENGSLPLQVLYTPGHTTDSVTYYSEKDHAAFVGDTIFKAAIGEWRYPGGNPEALQKSILESIFGLPEETVLYSGHSEATTVGEEKNRY